MLRFRQIIVAEISSTPIAVNALLFLGVIIAGDSILVNAERNGCAALAWNNWSNVEIIMADAIDVLGPKFPVLVLTANEVLDYVKIRCCVDGNINVFPTREAPFDVEAVNGSKTQTT